MRVRDFFERLHLARLVPPWVRSWWFRSWLAIDQLVNALGGPLFSVLHHGDPAGPFGEPDETISSVIGRVKLANDGHVPHSFWFMRRLDCFLSWLDPGHSIDAVEDRFWFGPG